MVYTVKEVHISTIKQGDTVKHEGILRTVCRNNIKISFCGVTLFGDSYKAGHTLVKKVIFKSCNTK